LRDQPRFVIKRHVFGINDNEQKKIKMTIVLSVLAVIAIIALPAIKGAKRVEK
jgi:hypothetical protein